jgi:hypothetical protein
MKYKHILFIILLAVVVACKGDRKTNQKTTTTNNQEIADKSELLLGRWKTSTFVNKEQFKKSIGEDMEEGMSGEMTMINEFQFIKGNRFNEEGEVTFKLTMGNQEIPLKFYGKQSGTWKLYGNTLVTVAEDSKIVPLDDITKSVVEAAPEFKAMIQPNKGESISYEIKLLTEKVMQVTDEDMPGMIITYNKK